MFRSDWVSGMGNNRDDWNCLRLLHDRGESLDVVMQCQSLHSVLTTAQHKTDSWQIGWLIRNNIIDMKW